MLVLQNWFGLSDERIEEQINDSLRFIKFCGLSLEDKIPDATVLCRFRKELNKKNVFEKLLDNINMQLKQKRVILNKGIMVDASITETERKPRGHNTYEVVEDRMEDTKADINKATSGAEEVCGMKRVFASNVDTEGAWL